MCNFIEVLEGQESGRSSPTVMLSAIAYFVGLLVTVSKSSDFVCNNAESCANSSVITRNGTDSIDCLGFHSCGNAVLKVKGTGQIRCHGSYSCYNSPSIYATNKSFTGLECYGLQSCANSSYIYIHGGSISAEGEKSLYNSHVYLNNSGTLNCFGDRSCANSIIYGSGYHSITGHLAAQNSVFISMTSGVIYDFHGASSGDGATIICSNDHSCTINCFGNACNNLTAICDDSTAGCDVSFANCEYAERSNNCPTDGYRLSTLMYEDQLINYSIPDINSLNNVSFSNYNNSFRNCWTGYFVFISVYIIV